MTGLITEKAEDTSKKEDPPKNYRSMLWSIDIGGMILTIGGSMFYQFMVEIVETKTLKMEKYQHVLSQSGGHISPTWVLLDNQSTINVFSNRHLLKNISKSDRDLEIFSTGRKTTTNLKGYHPRYGTVWSQPGSIKNVLYLSKLAEKYRVDSGITGENKFLVYLPMGEVRYLKKCDRGVF